MAKILTAAVILLVVVISAVTMHQHQVRSRQRSLSTYNAVTSYHAKVVEAAALGQRFIPERSPDESLLEGDPGYVHLEAMLHAAQQLSLNAAPQKENSAYQACDMLARHDLNLPLDPKHNYAMTMEMANMFCGPRLLR